jgi:hypothetical protein
MQTIILSQWTFQPDEMLPQYMSFWTEAKRTEYGLLKKFIMQGSPRSDLMPDPQRIALRHLKGDKVIVQRKEQQ